MMLIHSRNGNALKFFIMKVLGGEKGWNGCGKRYNMQPPKMSIDTGYFFPKRGLERRE